MSWSNEQNDFGEAESVHSSHSMPGGSLCFFIKCENLWFPYMGHIVSLQGLPIEWDWFVFCFCMSDLPPVTSQQFVFSQLDISVMVEVSFKSQLHSPTMKRTSGIHINVLIRTCFQVGSTTGKKVFMWHSEMGTPIHVRSMCTASSRSWLQSFGNED